LGQNTVLSKLSSKAMWTMSQEAGEKVGTVLIRTNLSMGRGTLIRRWVCGMGGGRRVVYDRKALIRDIVATKRFRSGISAFGGLHERDIVMLHSLKNTFFTNFGTLCDILYSQQQPC
jgi:hypothetical protein